ncbi:MAG: extracellular solute-binding protein [Halanaerobiales bacterium]|nr:extracellular solute-binding protein [Halanaerobiales bacterium]
MNKRSLVLVLVLMLVLSANALATKLVIWESAGPETKFLNSVIDQFTAETGIEIEVVAVDQLDQGSKLALDGPAGKGADILVWPHDRIGQAVLEGIIAPLDVTSEILAPYIGSTIDAMSYGGEVYGIPYSLETTALIYNKDLLPVVPNSMNALFAIAKEMTTEDQYGFLYDITNFYFTYGFLGGYGGYVFEKVDGGLDVESVGLANDGAIEGAELVLRFRTEGLIPEGTNYDVTDGLFKEGKVAAIINGPWSFKNYKDAGINYGIAPLPKLSNGNYPTTFIGVKGYYVSQFSENKDAALKFILWLTSKDIAFKHYEMSAIIPTNKEILEMPEFKKNADFLAFATQAGRGVPMPNVPEMGQVWDPMAAALTHILNQEATPDLALEMAVEQIQESIWEMKN